MGFDGAWHELTVRSRFFRFTAGLTLTAIIDGLTISFTCGDVTIIELHAVLPPLITVIVPLNALPTPVAC